MRKLSSLFSSIKMGAKVADHTDVETTEYIVRFKDVYLVVDEMSDGNFSVGWMRSPMGHVPVREYWKATPPKKAEEDSK